MRPAQRSPKLGAGWASSGRRVWSWGRGPDGANQELCVLVCTMQVSHVSEGCHEAPVRSQWERILSTVKGGGRGHVFPTVGELASVIS